MSRGLVPVLISAVLLAGPGGCARILHNRALVSSDPVVVRSNKPDREFLERLHRRYTLASIVTFRGRLSKDEQRFVEARNVRAFIFHWSADHKPPPQDLDRLVAIFEDQANYPMLLHCTAGADRTGLAVAVYRIERESVDPHRAMAEMKWYRHLRFLHPAMQEALRERYALHRRNFTALLKAGVFFTGDLLLLPVELGRSALWEAQLHACDSAR